MTLERQTQMNRVLMTNGSFLEGRDRISQGCLSWRQTNGARVILFQMKSLYEESSFEDQLSLPKSSPWQFGWVDVERADEQEAEQDAEEQTLQLTVHGDPKKWIEHCLAPAVTRISDSGRIVGDHGVLRRVAVNCW